VRTLESEHRRRREEGREVGHDELA
jgi:hypothetical protein